VTAFGNHALHGTELAGDTASPVHRLDPRAKVIGLVGVTLVAVTTPLSAWAVFVACGIVLGAVAVGARISPRTLWRRSRLVLPLVLLVALSLPFTKGGATVDIGAISVSRTGLDALLGVAIKATLGTASAVLLGATTTFPAVLSALESLRLPRLFVLIAGVVYRYLFVVVGEVQRMRAALVTRCYRPRSLLDAGAIGRVAAALFLRSHARGERVHLAMLSRGFTGSAPSLDVLRLRAVDVGFVLAITLVLVPVRLAEAL
jgi:cobalt/nickel transport system permease protein